MHAVARSLVTFAATIPAGTTGLSPHTVALDVGTAQVEQIRWRVPPGPHGHLAWHLSMGGTQVVPTGDAPDIVADDEVADIVLEDLPDQGSWQLVGTNSGTYDHTVYLQFLTSPVQAAGSAEAAPPPLDLLSPPT